MSRGRPRDWGSLSRTSSPSRCRRSRCKRTPLGCRPSCSASSTVPAGRPSSPSSVNRRALVGWESASSGLPLRGRSIMSLQFTQTYYEKPVVHDRVSSSDDVRSYRKGVSPMTYVITEPCIGTKDNSCVEVCPVDCIHPTPDEPGYDAAEMLFIDPEECIDCDACVEACPVDACFAEDQLPEEWSKYSQINV